MNSAVSPVSSSPTFAVSAGAASSSTAVLQQTSSTSLAAVSQSSSAAVGQGALTPEAAELLQALVLLLILQTLFGETDQAGTDALLGLLGTLGGGADGAAGAASASSSLSFLSFSQTTSTTLAVSQESAAFFAAEAYAPAPTRGGGGGFSALG